MHLADLVIYTGVEQDAFRRRGLARVNMGGDPDVRYRSIGVLRDTFFTLQQPASKR